MTIQLPAQVQQWVNDMNDGNVSVYQRDNYAQRLRSLVGEVNKQLIGFDKDFIKQSKRDERKRIKG
jgi:hypothetical protein